MLPDGGLILGLVILCVALWLMYRGIRFIRCAWCGGLTSTRDRTVDHTSDGICRHCLRAVRKKYGLDDE